MSSPVLCEVGLSAGKAALRDACNRRWTDAWGARFGRVDRVEAPELGGKEYGADSVQEVQLLPVCRSGHGERGAFEDF